jgi:hypothetical protein
LLDAERHEREQDQWHDRLRRAATGIAPACGCGVRGADDVRREHGRCVELRDNERCADRTDAQAPEEKAFVALRERDGDDGNRAECEQPGVGETCAEAIAERTDQQPDEDRDADGSDVDVGDLVAREPEFIADHRHQRRNRKPGEEAHEESHPREVEASHRNRRETQQLQSCRPAVHRSLH